MSIRRRLNDLWRFTKQNLNTELSYINSSDVSWNDVDLPHDWLIYNAKDLYETSEGWYQRNLTHTKEEGVRIALRFEGVYMDSTLFVNDKEVGEWKYGYSTFEFDITDYLVDGENDIKVRVVHESPNSRWYSGAGIYRSVWLKTMNEDHFVSDGIYISTLKDEKGFQLVVSSEITGVHSDAVILHTVYDAEGNQVGQSFSGLEASLGVETPILWSLENPYLYTLKSELLVNGNVVDTEIQTFGFRTTEFTCDKGFFLNGKHVKMNGVCQHHDLGALGAAVNKTALRRQLEILKDMGVNAIRTSHNMPAVELVELSDEMGFLLVNEGFDMWERSKTTYDYARFFNEWSAKDVASWVRRDRNHPSVIMWSIGNEIYDTHASERGQEITRYLMEQVQIHDPRSNAVPTIGSNFMPWENARKCADIIKYAGYNYAEKLYRADHEEHKDWIIYGSETASVVQSRGIYHFPYSQSILSDDDEQCSALGNSTTSWGAKNHEYCIIAERDHEFSLGQFIWTGFDYIGEPTPYHTKNSYFGQIDTAGFPKDSYYLYQAEWTDYKTKPMVHLFPYWDFNEGQLIDVRVCSNAPTIELFFNGESLGTYDIDHAHGTQLTGNWQIPYKKGTLEAVAYDENGNVIARDVKRSFGEAANIILTPDKTELMANGEDLIFLEISMEDEEGNPVENANNRVEVQVTGAGRLVGLDNGDSTDYDEYKGTSRRLFSGKLLAIVAAKLEAGDIKVQVSSVGLPTKTLDFKALPCEKPEGVTAIIENQLSESNMEIPVRKIEITSPMGQKFNENLTEMKIAAKIFPENATYQRLEWRAINDAGVDSLIAKVELLDPSGKEVVVKVLGDGNFNLRCSSKNGDENVRLMSQLNFSATGLGEGLINPYEFISGSLYDVHGGDIGTGNERGISTARDGKSWFGFTNLDFGSFGSDVVTLPIFELESAPTTIEFWEGIPYEDGSQMVGKGIYHKQSIWNMYQEETFRLDKRLRGITTLCMVLDHKAHIKGFQFKKLEKAFETLKATENSNLYGDTFTLKEDCIEGIGNNVSLVFEEMDFGDRGFKELVICGNSPIDVNTIHVRFFGEDGEVRQIAEFTKSEGFEERTFALDCVKGLQTVTFVFLPGCNFDFKWFRFQ